MGSYFVNRFYTNNLDMILNPFCTSNCLVVPIVGGDNLKIFWGLAWNEKQELIRFIYRNPAEIMTISVKVNGFIIREIASLATAMNKDAISIETF